jgi:hypothetical protein
MTMQRMVGTIVAILLFALPVFAQGQSLFLSDAQKAYEEFDYTRVISVSELLLAHRDTLTESSWITLLTLNGASHFIRGEEIAARGSFLEILKVDSAFALDPVLYSPKIVEFVNQIKSNTPKSTDLQRTSNDRKVLDEQKHPSIEQFSSHSFGNVVARSILLPGWGHLTVESSPKGWFLTTAATFALSSGMYYIVQTNKREHEYLNETNRQNIAEKYEDYNSAYKTRNIILGVYAVVWTAAQLDLLYFSHDELTGKVSLSYRSIFQSDPPQYPSLTFKFSF